MQSSFSELEYLIARPDPKMVPRAPPKSLAAIEAQHQVRNEAIIEAYSTGAYSYREIAEHFGLHLATVGRIVRSAMQQSEV